MPTVALGIRLACNPLCMLNSEKNAFFAALERTDYRPPSFEYEEVDPSEYLAAKRLQSPGIRLTFPGSKLWFVFFKANAATNDGKPEPLFACRWSEYDYVTEQYLLYDWYHPENASQMNDDRGYGFPMFFVSLAQATTALADWAERVLPRFVQETGTPDLWRAEPVITPIQEIVPLLNDEPFTAEERQHVASAVDGLRAYILSEHAVTEQDIAEVNRRFSALERAISQMGRASWITFAIGTVVSIASALCLSNEDGRRLLEMTRDALNTALQYYLR